MGPLTRSGALSPKAEMIGIGVVSAALGVFVIGLGLMESGAVQGFLLVAGASVVTFSVPTIVIGLRRYGPERRLPPHLRDANTGPPAERVLVFGDGRHIVGVVFRGGYAL